MRRHRIHRHVLRVEGNDAAVGREPESAVVAGPSDRVHPAADFSQRAPAARKQRGVYGGRIAVGHSTEFVLAEADNPPVATHPQGGAKLDFSERTTYTESKY